MTETDLQEAIGDFTITHKRLPYSIQANYQTGVKIATFSGFMATENGAVYLTPFGKIPIVLNANAGNFLLEDF